MPLLYPKGTNGYSEYTRDLVPALINSEDTTSSSEGMMMALASLTTNGGKTFSDVLDVISAEMAKVKGIIGPSTAASAFTADAGYRKHMKDVFGSDWHPVFDPDEDGVDDTQLMIITFILVLFQQLGIPLLKIGGKTTSSFVKGLSEHMFRHVLTGKHNKTHDLLGELKDRSVDRANVNVDKLLTNEGKLDDNKLLVRQLMNAIQFNNKSYLS